MSQTTLSGTTTPYRTIVKDAYTTRDAGDSTDTRLEIVAWRVETVADEDDDEEPIKDEQGHLRYDRILNDALDELGADELARRTGLKSYADSRGGRAASTIRSYRSKSERLAPADEGGLKSSHPAKRVLRRYARSRGMGHYRDDKSQQEGPGPSEPDADAAPIDLSGMKGAYRLARSIASQAGFTFAPQSGDPVAVEDNERIDHDEIRRHDRPLGETKAAVMLTKPSGQTYEYSIDLDAKDLDSLDGAIPPGGW